MRFSMYRISTLIFIFLVCCATISAQDAISTTDQLIADIFEQYTSQTEDEIDYASFYEDLMYCAEHPINLNKSSREELGRLPFLSDMQLENILAYVYQNGKLQTIFELQLIEGLDMTDIRRMLPFVRLGEVDESFRKIYWNELWNYGNNELMLRFDHALEKKEGYQMLPNASQPANAPSKAYAGNALYTSLKYRFAFKNRVLFGCTAEKDPGEQFLGKVHTGYDYYSAYAQVNELGKIKTLVVGDFRANFGQGLVLSSEFGLGKSAYVLNVSPRNSGLKKYSSTDENNFFRGVGLTVRLHKVDISLFYSNKMRDADTSNGSFSSFYSTGLHRTDSEMAKKHTVNEQVIGGNATFNFSTLQLGFTAVKTSFNSLLIPDKSSYNSYYFSGNEQTVGGINYRLRWQKINFFGETALTDKAAVATLNGLNFSPISTLSLVVLQRYYSPHYDTFYASAFAESSRINNENGLYMGAEIRPFAKWKFAAYADSYQFPWLKYGVDAPSLGADYLLQVDFAGRRNISMYWRLKYEDNQKNVVDNTSVMGGLDPIKKASLRYNLLYSVGNFSFKNVLEGNLFRRSTQPCTYGLLALQDVSYAFTGIPLKLDVHLQLFDATDYENRLYSYEKDILYAFSIPMFYGQGSRYYLNLRYEPTEHLSLWFKIAQTVYADDRQSIGSGNETIKGNRKTDVRFLLKYNF